MARLAQGWVRVALTVLHVAVATVSATLPASAQGPTTGVLRGEVRDEGGSMLGQALVTVTEQETGIRRSVFTDPAGRFELGQLVTGQYDLLVERLGFPPVRLSGVAVRPGRSSNVRVQLVAGGPEGADPQAAAALPGGLPGTSQWIPSFALHSLPAARGELDEAMRLSTWTDERSSVEGLPSWLTSFAIDGVPYRSARHPLLSMRGDVPLLRLGGLSGAEVVGNAFDVEWGTAAGATLSAHTRRGTARGRLEGAARWSGSTISSPGAFDAGELSYQNLDGSLELRGPALSDSARYVAGIALRQWERPVAPAWPANEQTAQLAAFGEARGLELGDGRAATVQPLDAIAGFGGIDWSVAEGHRFGLAVHAASAPSQLDLPGSGALESSRRDVFARATLRSQRASGTRNTLNLSAASSSRETTAPDAFRSTVLVPLGVNLGAGLAASGSESSFRIADALELGRGDLKVGADLTFTSYDYSHRPLSAGTYYFGGLPQLENGVGVYVRNTGTAGAATWSDARFGVFAQNRWRTAGGLELVLGARLDREGADPGVRQDRGWLDLTGIANEATELSGWRLSPRFALTWDVERSQEWLLHAAGGLYHDRVDPLVVAEWKLEDGTGETVRSIGSFGSTWPEGEPASTARARRLTLLGPDFRGPRTARFSGGVMHRLAAGTAVQLDATYRETQYLPRRADVNLLQSAAARDGAGRGVFGTLVQQGGLLVAEPANNRRFPTYDEVAVYNADGWSRFWGATLSAQHAAGGGLSFLARYTFSSTTDNWFGAGSSAGAGINVPTALNAAEWDEGTSDFDLPHRLAIGAAYEAPLGVRLSAVYRWQSGRPFTPGYRAGVDANGDGTPGNDPAFIDPSVTGVNALFGSWSCLQDRSGRLAERNACRGDATQALDLRASMRLLRLGRGELALSVEALDLLETDYSATDAALYLVNPDATVQRNEAARTITLPLMVNPDFGKPLATARPGRLLRIGAALTL